MSIRSAAPTSQCVQEPRGNTRSLRLPGQRSVAPVTSEPVGKKLMSPHPPRSGTHPTGCGNGMSATIASHSIVRVCFHMVSPTYGSTLFHSLACVVRQRWVSHPTMSMFTCLFVIMLTAVLLTGMKKMLSFMTARLRARGQHGSDPSGHVLIGGGLSHRERAIRHLVFH